MIPHNEQRADAPLLFPEEKIVRRRGNDDDGGDGMDDLKKRVEQLEKDTNQIRVDMATLLERSQNFATQSSLSDLSARAESFATKADLAQQLSASESRITSKIDSINNRIIWTLMIPAIVAILLWFVKTAILKV